MALHRLLRLWFFLFMFWPCSLVWSDNRQPRGRRLGGTTNNLLLGGMCASVTQKYSRYKCEDYEVQTRDGYILSLVNIAAGKDEFNTSSKQPVVLQHGVMADGMTWVLNPPDQSLGFILADEGFDVWIINTRGTKFSRRHITLDPALPDFWNWSWDELSKYDLPAALGFIFKKTRQKMHIIGHSMGATQILTTLSERRELDKLKSASLFCPVAYLTHMTSLIDEYACKAFLGELAIAFGLPEFDVKQQPAATFLQLLCDLPLVNCFNMMDAFTGPNCCLNNSESHFDLQHLPQPTSTKTLVHFAQSNRDGAFRKYDYGSSMANGEQYGQPEPPDYDLTRIPNDFPLYISYGALDSLSDPKDVETILDKLNGHDQDKLKVQFVQQFAHVDFIMGTTAKDVVYRPLIDYLKSQN